MRYNAPRSMINLPKYRADQYGCVYKYDRESDAYYFVGKLHPNESLEDFIASLQNRDDDASWIDDL